MTAIRSMVAGVSLVALTMTSVSPAFAQVRPGAEKRLNATVQQPASPTPTPSATMLGDLPAAIVVQQALGDGLRPSSITPDTARRDSPVYTWEQFQAQYKPRRGPDGQLIDPDAQTLYRIIAASNKDLCEQAGMLMSELTQIDSDYAAADEDYLALAAVYETLPKHLKRSAGVMTVAQAAGTGALCALSLGMYCIAAVFIAGGNIFSTHANLKLQLANARLSAINIRHSRTNIRHSRATVRMDALWVRAFSPYCKLYVKGWSVPALQATAPQAQQPAQQR